jgi:hypothetical protein
MCSLYKECSFLRDPPMKEVCVKNQTDLKVRGNRFFSRFCAREESRSCSRSVFILASGKALLLLLIFIFPPTTLSPQHKQKID